MARPVVLAIDAVGAKHSGAATVLQAIVAAALSSSRVERLIVFCSPRQLRLFELPNGPRLVEREVSNGDSGPLSRISWQLRRLPAEVSASGADVVLCLSGGGIPPRGVPSVVLVQQSLPFAPEALARLSWRDRVRFRSVRWMMRAACRRATLVIVQTPTMRDRVAATFGTALGRLAVVEPDVSLLASTLPAAVELASMRAAPAGRRILYVGNTSEYKNLCVLTAAMAVLRRRLPDASLFATVPQEHPIVRADGVHHLPHLPPSTLREAYTLATALVMPSLVETVGLPMLEAASVGTPVVAADRPYARDVCGDAALYFDPLDPESLARQLALILCDETLRLRLAESGHKRAAARSAARPYERLVDLVVEQALMAAGAS